MDYENSKEAFECFMNRFDKKNTFILEKYIHTLSVVRWMEKLAKRLQMTEEEIVLAKIIGLLHDIGRFGQIDKTNICDDTKSNVDHAKYGCRYLFFEKHIRDFIKSDKYDKVIEDVILNHNTLKVSKAIDPYTRKFTYMLRDMDKLDIFRVMAVHHELELVKEDVKKHTLQQFQKEQLINRKCVKTKSEWTLNYLSFVFDIHFKESYELLEESDNVELFMASLKIPKYSEEFAEKIIKAVRTKINQNI